MNVTSVSPTGNSLPVAGPAVCTILAAAKVPSSVSNAIGGAKLTTAPHAPSSLSAVKSAKQNISGASPELIAQLIQKLFTVVTSEPAPSTTKNHSPLMSNPANAVLNAPSAGK